VAVAVFIALGEALALSEDLLASTNLAHRLLSGCVDDVSWLC
jgi:hypothetical protein